MIKYPKNYNEFINLCTKNQHFFDAYKKLGSPRPFDVSLRDGLQGLTKIEQQFFTLDKKKDLFHKIIDEQNPQYIEVGSILSTSSSSKILPIFNDSKKLFQYVNQQIIKENKNTNINININIKPFLLVPSIKSLQTILLDDSIKDSHFSFITSVSDGFQYKNTKKTVEETRMIIKNMLEPDTESESESVATEQIKKKHIKLYISCINECPIEGKKDNDFIINEIMKYNHEKINTICLSDTMGTLDPSDFEYIVDNCNKNGLPFSKMSLHLHIKKEQKYIAEKLFHKALDRNIVQFDVSAIESGGCSVTMDKNQLNPNLTYETYYEFLTNYILGEI